MKRLISFFAVGIALQYSLGGVAGCSSAEPAKKAAPTIGKHGTLEMALEATSDSGKVYRLRNATFFVNESGFFFDAPAGGALGGTSTSTGPIGAGGATGSGPAPTAGGFFGVDGGVSVGGFFGVDGGVSVGGFPTGGMVGSAGFFSTGGSTGFAGFPTSSGTIVLSSEDNPDSPVIERFLSPNSYDIELLDGWFIEQVDSLLGTSGSVDATLQSSSFQFFTIQSDQESFVKFDFLVDGRRVSFGPPGRLIIGIGIQETNGQTSCGDGIVEAGEECDGADTQGATCASVTMGSLPFGQLFCSASCKLDTSFCFGGTFDGGTGGGIGTGGGTGFEGGVPSGGSAGSVGFPVEDAGAGAGGASGKPPFREGMHRAPLETQSFLGERTGLGRRAAGSRVWGEFYEMGFGEGRVRTTRRETTHESIDRFFGTGSGEHRSFDRVRASGQREHAQGDGRTHRKARSGASGRVGFREGVSTPERVVPDFFVHRRQHWAGAPERGRLVEVRTRDVPRARELRDVPARRVVRRAGRQLAANDQSGGRNTCQRLIPEFRYSQRRRDVRPLRFPGRRSARFVWSSWSVHRGHRRERARSRSPPSGLNARRSLIENNQTAVASFSLEGALQAIQVNSGLAPDPNLLYRQIVDSYASAPGQEPTAKHCGDETTGGSPSLNGFPIRCDRLEAQQIGNLGKWFPTGAVNRVDLAPADGSHCGQQRLMFANNAPIGNSRMFMILEAQIPNPHPECGVAACRPLADFWAKMSDITDPKTRGALLSGAFLTGDPDLVAAGFPAFINVQNLSVGTGSIRTNNFDDFEWTLRQFKVMADTTGQTRAIPFPVADAPHGELWNDNVTLPAGAACRQNFLTALDGLLSDNPAEMAFTVDDACYDSESPNDFLTQNYPQHLASGSGKFTDQLTARLVGTGLTPQDIATRAQFAGSCIGCHEEANGVSLGHGVVSPFSNGFVQIDEEFTEDCGDGTQCFTASPALKQVFLPRRMRSLTDLLAAAACSPSAPDGGAPHGDVDGGAPPPPSAADAAPSPPPRNAADGGGLAANAVLSPTETINDLVKQDNAAHDKLAGQTTLGGQPANVTH